MERGDISDRLPPRWLFVFEGVIANVPPAKLAEWKLAMRLGRWKRAVNCFELETHVQKVIWDMYWRRDYRFDIVTFLGEPFAEKLQTWLERMSLPFGNCWAVDEDSLAQRLVFMPDVQYVIHGDPSKHLTYGNRGLLVTDPERLQL